MFELNEQNFIMYAIKHYDNPACKGINEFYDDIKRFKYLKRLFKKYKPGLGQKERLILNHIVIIYNLFGMEAATRLLFFKLEPKYWSQLKTFLVYLNVMPIGPIPVGNFFIERYEIPIDETVSEALGKL